MKSDDSVNISDSELDESISANPGIGEKLNWAKLTEMKASNFDSSMNSSFNSEVSMSARSSMFNSFYNSTDNSMMNNRGASNVIFSSTDEGSMTSGHTDRS